MKQNCYLSFTSKKYRILLLYWKNMSVNKCFGRKDTICNAYLFNKIFKKTNAQRLI